jgi:antitoxin CptB
MTETPEARIKRLYMRSIRRGIKEMDLILTAYAQGLDRMSDADLTLYDQLLAENDHDLLSWVTGGAAAPITYDSLMPGIRTAATSVGLTLRQ